MNYKIVEKEEFVEGLYYTCVKSISTAFKVGESYLCVWVDRGVVHKGLHLECDTFCKVQSIAGLGSEFILGPQPNQLKLEEML